MSPVRHDPTLYKGTAAYYITGRPPYSRELVPVLRREVDLDGTGRLLDVGCGPGTLTLELASWFDEVIGLDPDGDMLAEGVRRANQSGLTKIRWIRAVAEDIPRLDLGTFKLVTFGQSFQWTDRDIVARAVYELLEPSGALAFIWPTVEGRVQPVGPGYPLIPHEAVSALLDRYLGTRRRAGQGHRPEPGEPYADTLTRVGFVVAEPIYAQGRDDIVRDTDGVLANYLSTSFAAPHLFGDQLDAFEADLRAELAAQSPSGLFWDWPGDTVILIGRKRTATT